MADKPNITVTLHASGVNRDGVRIEAMKEGFIEDFDRMKRQLEDLLSRNDAKPLPEEAELEKGK